VRKAGGTALVHVLVSPAACAKATARSSASEVAMSKDAAGSLALARSWRVGLTGVVLVIADAHEGLIEAIAEALAGSTRGRCSDPRARGICLPPWPRRTQPSSCDPGAYHRRCARRPRGGSSVPPSGRGARNHAARGCLRPRARPLWPAGLVARALASSGASSCAPTRKECLGQEVRRRTDGVGIFPDRAAIIRLVSSLQQRATPKWADERRSLSARALAKVQRVYFAGTDDGRQHALAVLLAAEDRGLITRWSRHYFFGRGPRSRTRTLRHRTCLRPGY
jgi:putative transposase